MDQKQLLATLNSLHRELTQTSHADPETLSLLQAITQDIQNLLARTDDVPSEESESVVSAVRALSLKFEAEHPRLASTLHQITDALANLGI